MTDRPPDNSLPAGRSRLDAVAVLAIVLLGALLSVIVALGLWSEPAGAPQASRPLVTIELPPAPVPMERASSTASEPAEPARGGPEETRSRAAEAPADQTRADQTRADQTPTTASDGPAPQPEPPAAVEQTPPPPIAPQTAPDTAPDTAMTPAAPAGEAAKPEPPGPVAGAPPGGAAEASRAPPPESPPVESPPMEGAPPESPPPERLSTGSLPPEPPQASPAEPAPTPAPPLAATQEEPASPETPGPRPEPPAEATAETTGEPPGSTPSAPGIAPRIATIPAPPAYQPTQRRELSPAPDGLPPAPDAGLLEASPSGPLPIIGKDGRKPWRVYSRPFDARDARPRVAIVIAGMGQSAAATEAAIQRLPGAVTLAFAPFAKNLDQWIALARAAGHETLMTVPMEPFSAEHDPGPYALLTSLSERDNRDRLLFLLSRTPGYVGVLNSMGGRFTTTAESLRPILSEIHRRGLLFVDAKSSPRSLVASQAGDMGLPYAVNDGFIDIKASRGEIDARLEELERIARDEGFALGIGSPYPVTIERVALWVQELETKGIALAPVSALVDKRPD